MRTALTLLLGALSLHAQFDYCDQAFLARVRPTVVVAGGSSVTPASVAGLAAWWNADTLAGTLADGAKVTTWTNAVGGVSLTNSTGANEPLWKANVINGHAALRFTNSTYSFLFTCNPQHWLLTNFTMIVIGKYAVDGLLFSSGSAARYWQVRARYGNENTFEVWRNNEYYRVYASPALVDSWGMLILGNPNEGYESWGAFNKATNYTSGNSTGRGGISIVGDYLPDRGSHFAMGGDLAEFVVYTNTLSTNDLVNLYTNYFKGRYSLP